MLISRQSVVGLLSVVVCLSAGTFVSASSPARPWEECMSFIDMHSFFAEEPAADPAKRDFVRLDLEDDVINALIHYSASGMEFVQERIACAILFSMTQEMVKYGLLDEEVRQPYHKEDGTLGGFYKSRESHSGGQFASYAQMLQLGFRDTVLSQSDFFYICQFTSLFNDGTATLKEVRQKESVDSQERKVLSRYMASLLYVSRTLISYFATLPVRQTPEEHYKVLFLEWKKHIKNARFEDASDERGLYDPDAPSSFISQKKQKDFIQIAKKFILTKLHARDHAHDSAPVRPMGRARSTDSPRPIPLLPGAVPPAEPSAATGDTSGSCCATQWRIASHGLELIMPVQQSRTASASASSRVVSASVPASSRVVSASASGGGGGGSGGAEPAVYRHDEARSPYQNAYHMVIQWPGIIDIADDFTSCNVASLDWGQLETYLSALDEKQYDSVQRIFLRRFLHNIMQKYQEKKLRSNTNFLLLCKAVIGLGIKEFESTKSISSENANGICLVLRSERGKNSKLFGFFYSEIFSMRPHAQLSDTLDGEGYLIQLLKGTYKALTSEERFVHWQSIMKNLYNVHAGSRDGIRMVMNLQLRDFNGDSSIKVV